MDLNKWLSFKGSLFMVIENGFEDNNTYLTVYSHWNIPSSLSRTTSVNNAFKLYLSTSSYYIKEKIKSEIIDIYLDSYFYVEINSTLSDNLKTLLSAIEFDMSVNYLTLTKTRNQGISNYSEIINVWLSLNRSKLLEINFGIDLTPINDLIPNNTDKPVTLAKIIFDVSLYVHVLSRIESLESQSFATMLLALIILVTPEKYVMKLELTKRRKYNLLSLIIFLTVLNITHHYLWYQLINLPVDWSLDPGVRYRTPNITYLFYFMPFWSSGPWWGMYDEFFNELLYPPNGFYFITNLGYSASDVYFLMRLIYFNGFLIYLVAIIILIELFWVSKKK